jgi:hypothetical protein
MAGENAPYVTFKPAHSGFWIAIVLSALGVAFALVTAFHAPFHRIGDALGLSGALLDATGLAICLGVVVVVIGGGMLLFPPFFRQPRHAACGAPIVNGACVHAREVEDLQEACQRLQREAASVQARGADLAAAYGLFRDIDQVVCGHITAAVDFTEESAFAILGRLHGVDAAVQALLRMLIDFGHQSATAADTIRSGLADMQAMVVHSLTDRVERADAGREISQLDSFSRQLVLAAGGYDQLKHCLTAMIDGADRHGKEVADLIMHALASVQFQDVVRQRLQQVCAALVALDACNVTLTDSLGDLRSGGDIATTVIELRRLAAGEARHGTTDHMVTSGSAIELF